MIIADLHNDTAYELFHKRKQLKKNDLNIDLTKQSFSKNLLFYSICHNNWEDFLNVYNYFIKEVDKNDEIKLFESVSDFLYNNKHNAFMCLEGGGLIEDISDIEKLNKLKIGLITLNWSDENKIATNNGLTDFGKDAILKMNELNIFCDLSHASDKTFFDVINHTKKPVFVSHSNSRVLCLNKRNITDEMFTALIKNGGILGINFYSEFVGEHTVFDHIEHFLNSGGENNIAFGSDFDGCPSFPEGILDFTSYKNIYLKLQKRFGKDIAEKIIYKNVLNLLKEVY